MIGPLKITAGEYFYKGWKVFREGKIWTMTPEGNFHPTDAANSLRDAFNFIDHWEKTTLADMRNY